MIRATTIPAMTCAAVLARMVEILSSMRASGSYKPLHESGECLREQNSVFDHIVVSEEGSQCADHDTLGLISHDRARERVHKDAGRNRSDRNEQRDKLLHS